MILHIGCIFFCIFFCILSISSEILFCIFCILFCILHSYFVHIILHILHIFIHAYCAYLAYCYMHVVHVVHTHKGKCLDPIFHCLLPLLLGPPSQGPAVYVPPPTTITTACWFIAASSGKVSRFLSHGEGNCPGRPHWNKRKASEYWGNWNHIEDLCLFTAFVDDCRLTLIHPGWGR